MTKPNGAVRTILLLAGATVAIFGTLWGISLASLDNMASVESVEAVRANVLENTDDVREIRKHTALIGERLARMEANQERILRKLEE